MNDQSSSEREYKGGIYLAARQFVGNYAAVAGSVALCMLCLAAIFAPWLSPYDPTVLKLSAKLQPPNLSHWMGTDFFGRDVLTRIVWGGRVSLLVALMVVVYSMMIGVPLGLVAGFAGGKLDNILMRVMDAFLTFPPLLLAVAIVGLMGPDLKNVVIALAIVQIPVFARIVRGSTLSAREEVYIMAARALGASRWRIVFSGILRNIVSPIVVQVTIVFAVAIVAEASLSFLGLGSQPPDPSWGRDLSDARRYMTDAPWLLVGPTLAIMMCVLSINFIGDGLRDSLDPRSWRTRTMKKNAPTIEEPDLVVTAAMPSQAAAPEPVLQVRDLCTRFDTEEGVVRAVDGVSFDLKAGEILGIVGESGSGKSVTALSIMKLIVSPPGHVTAAEITLEGQDILNIDEAAARHIRGSRIAMIFQDPMQSLNPVLTIGRQLTEALREHLGFDRRKARDRAIELLSTVGIPGPESRLGDYPHQFSGGMRQRVMIAIALSCNPRILIADEATTALDVTIQAQIIDLVRHLVQEMDAGVIWISHDLGVVAGLCDKVAVMYAGRIVETGSVRDLFHRPSHGYTLGLLGSTPRLDDAGDRRLQPIDGTPPDLIDVVTLCPFLPRCVHAVAACRDDAPEWRQLDPGHTARCWADLREFWRGKAP